MVSLCTYPHDIDYDASLPRAVYSPTHRTVPFLDPLPGTRMLIAGCRFLKAGKTQYHRDVEAKQFLESLIIVNH